MVLKFTRYYDKSQVYIEEKTKLLEEKCKLEKEVEEKELLVESCTKSSDKEIELEKKMLDFKDAG